MFLLYVLFFNLFIYCDLIEFVQAQLETFVAQRTTQLEQLDSQLAAAKVRELDLSSKLTEANQRVCFTRN